MKIIDKSTKENIKNFSQIRIGNVFCTAENPDVFYMKTDKICDYCDNGFDVERRILSNAVDLDTGLTEVFWGDTKVVPLYCECTIINK